MVKGVAFDRAEDKAARPVPPRLAHFIAPIDKLDSLRPHFAGRRVTRAHAHARARARVLLSSPGRRAQWIKRPGPFPRAWLRGFDPVGAPGTRARGVGGWGGWGERSRDARASRSALSLPLPLPLPLPPPLPLPLSRVRASRGTGRKRYAERAGPARRPVHVRPAHPKSQLRARAGRKCRQRSDGGDGRRAGRPGRGGPGPAGQTRLLSLGPGSGAPGPTAGVRAGGGASRWIDWNGCDGSLVRPLGVGRGGGGLLMRRTIATGLRFRPARGTGAAASPPGRKRAPAEGPPIPATPGGPPGGRGRG